MALGYVGKPFVLALDRREDFTSIFGGAQASNEQRAERKAATSLVWEGVKHALALGLDPQAIAVVIDDEQGGAVTSEATRLGVRVIARLDGEHGELVDRSVWAPGIKAWCNGERSRGEAAGMIGQNVKHFIDTYSEAA